MAYLDKWKVYDIAGCGRDTRWVCAGAWTNMEAPECDPPEFPEGLVPVTVA